MLCVQLARLCGVTSLLARRSHAPTLPLPHLPRGSFYSVSSLSPTLVFSILPHLHTALSAAFDCTYSKHTHTLITSWARPHTSDPYTFQQIAEAYNNSNHEHPAARPRPLHRHSWCNAARCRAHRTQTVARPWRPTKSCSQPCRRGMLLPLLPITCRPPEH
jgi:hypothetical protein